MSDVVENRMGRYWLDDDELLRGVVAPGAVYTLEDAIANMEMYRGLAAGKRRCLLINMSGMTSMTREVRAYFASPLHLDVLLAVALVVGSPLSRVIGNFFLGMNRPPVPTRLFNADEQAIAWLRSMGTEA